MSNKMLRGRFWLRDRLFILVLFNRKTQLTDYKMKLKNDKDGSAAFYCTLWHRRIKGEREDLENKFHSSLKEKGKSEKKNPAQPSWSGVRELVFGWWEKSEFEIYRLIKKYKLVLLFV